MCAKVEQKLLDAGAHQVMTEICSSHRMEEMPFQPPFHHALVQTDRTSQASHKHQDLPFPTSYFASSSLTCNPPHSSLYFFFPSLTDLCLHAVLSCWAPASMIPAVCSRWRTMGGKTLQAKRSDCGLTAKENGRHHQVLQAASFTLRRTLDQIKTGPPRILFPGETPHACWRHSFVKLYNILNDANRRQLWGVGTRKADTTLHLSLRWWESSGMVTTEKTSSEQSLQNCGLPCSLV